MIIVMRAAKEQMQWQAPFGLLLRGVKCRSYYRNGESFKGSRSVSIRLPRAKWLSHYATPYDILHACMYITLKILRYALVLGWMTRRLYICAQTCT